ncbi:hypothetical protein OPV22_024729 [Ensete ventricosum]|uniref:Ubiquitin-like domain-containing protein n=1 Tax=Ensete ventricosum TaxID=4639 RepID=A0AAV8P6P2_ENSVE|nr:hypothetical protein OPV22_024729 [Ensete ventricosum]
MMRRSGSEGRSAEETWGVAAGWEMRPGGLLVQQRAPVPGKPPPPQVRVRISHGAARYVVSVSSIATFGELKKLLTADSGLQPAEQRLLYKGKQRGDSEYLDACGVKNRSKIVLVEDSTSLERRYTEIRKNARMQSAHRAVSTISLEVDKLADQVTTIEKSIKNGNKVTEVQITTLIELLMRQAVRLDSISAEGDASSQRNLQAKRVQKCVETLDVLKVSSSKLKPVVVTTNWETFDPPTTTQWEYFE